MKLRNGDVLRVRHITHVEKDGTQTGYRAAEEGSRKEDKRVFVLLLLGTEPMHIDETLNQGADLDVQSALRQLGYYSEKGEDEEVIERIEKEKKRKKVKVRARRPDE